MQIKFYKLTLIFLVLIISFLTISSSGYEKVTIKIISKDAMRLSEKPILQVFNNQNRDLGTKYKILSDDYKFDILDESVYGLCFTEKIQIESLIINDLAYPLNTLKKSSKCIQETQIKKINNQISNNFLKISKLLSILIILLLTFGAISLYNLKALKNKSTLSFILIIFATLATLYTWVYPGLINIDFLNSYVSTKKFQADGWFTYLCNVLMQSLLNFWDSPRVFVLSTFISFGVILTTWGCIISEIKGANNWKYLLFGILLLPSVWGHLGAVTRDIYANLGSIFLYSLFALTMVMQINNKLKHFHFFDLVMMIVSVFIMSIRSDFMPCSFLFLVIYLKTREITLSEKLKSIASFMIIIIVSITAREILTPNYLETKKVKLIASLSHPIGTIIHKSDKGIKKEHGEVLSRYVDMTKIKTFYVDNEIPAFHNGALKANWDSNLTPLLNTMKELIFEQPRLFLITRIKMMYFLFSGGEKTHVPSWHSIDHEFPSSNLGLINESKLYSLNNPLFPKATSLIKNIFQTIISNTYLKYLFSTIPSGLILLFCIFSFKKVPISASIAILSFARLPIFFLLVPASQHKYIFDIFIIGMLIIPLLIWELKERRSICLIQR